MHWHSLPAARGCAVGRPRRRAAAHPPLRPPTRAYSPICPPRSSRLLEPPEEVDARSRGSSRGWSPERRGCPRSRASRHPRRGGQPVAPQWSWPILVVSLLLSALARHRKCTSNAHTAALLSMGPGPAHKGSGPLCAGLGSGFSHLHWDERRYTLSPAISAAHLQKKEASKGVRWTAPKIACPHY